MTTHTARAKGKETNKAWFYFLGESKVTGASLTGFSNQSGGVFGAGLSGALLATMGYPGTGYLCLAFTAASALVATVFARQMRVNAG